MPPSGSQKELLSTSDPAQCERGKLLVANDDIVSTSLDSIFSATMECRPEPTIFSVPDVNTSVAIAHNWTFPCETRLFVICYLKSSVVRLVSGF